MALRVSLLLLLLLLLPLPLLVFDGFVVLERLDNLLALLLCVFEGDI